MKVVFPCLCMKMERFLFCLGGGVLARTRPLHGAMDMLLLTESLTVARRECFRRPPMTATAVESETPPTPSGSLPALGLAALGVVFGDIGTSPLYTLKTVVALAGGKLDASARRWACCRW